MFLIKSKTQSSNLPLQFIVSRHLFLLGHTNSFSLVASGLGMLSSGSEAPVVSQTSMSPNLLQTLQILSQLVVQDVSHHLVSFAILMIPLPVKEPIRNLVLTRVLHDSDNLFNIFLSQFTSPLGKRNVGLLENDVGISTSNTLDRGQSKHNIGFSLNVGVKNTKNMLEVRWNQPATLWQCRLLSCRSESSNI